MPLSTLPNPSRSPSLHRSFALQFLLSTAFVKICPARAGLWEGLVLQNFWDAVAHPEHVLLSNSFKTSRTFGTLLSHPLPAFLYLPFFFTFFHPPFTFLFSFALPLHPPFTFLFSFTSIGIKALHLTPEFIAMLQAYIRIVRPLCYDAAGVLLPPSLAGDAPLLVNPRSGRRISKLSRHLVTFFGHTTGLRLTATRLRQIWFTTVAEKCSARATSNYAAADTHSGTPALLSICLLPAAPFSTPLFLPSFPPRLYKYRFSSPLFLPSSPLSSPGATARRFYLKRSALAVGLDAAATHRDLLADAAASSRGAKEGMDDNRLADATASRGVKEGMDDNRLADATASRGVKEGMKEKATASSSSQECAPVRPYKRRRVRWTSAELKWLSEYLASHRSCDVTRRWVLCREAGAGVLLPCR